MKVWTQTLKQCSDEGNENRGLDGDMTNEASEQTHHHFHSMKP